MTVAAANEVYQVTVHGRLEGQECLNIMYFVSYLGDADVETHLLKAILNCIVDSLTPVLGTAYTLERISGKRVTPDVGPELNVLPEVGDTVTGEAEGDTLPSYASCRIRIRSERGGKSGLGRICIGGVPEIATTRSFIDPESAFWIALVAYVACVVSAFLVGGFPVANRWNLGVMSRKIGGEKPPFLLDGFSKATSLEPVRALGTMRSRLVGHGS